MQKIFTENTLIFYKKYFILFKMEGTEIGGIKSQAGTMKKKIRNIFML